MAYVFKTAFLEMSDKRKEGTWFDLEAATMLCSSFKQRNLDALAHEFRRLVL
jgi:hypothetical protein